MELFDTRFFEMLFLICFGISWPMKSESKEMFSRFAIIRHLSAEFGTCHLERR